MSRKVIVLGAGFSGLSTAAYLAQYGFSVEILEKHPIPGGRARKMEAEGFVFDMGPSWYWMPDVFDKFFADFNHHVTDFYKLDRLNPGYRMYFGVDEKIDVPANINELYDLFESIEKGSAKKLEGFLKDFQNRYKLALEKIIYKPSLSMLEFMNLNILSGLFATKSFHSLTSCVRSLFKDIRLIRLLEFPVLFLGTAPNKMPSLYSLMNYSGLELGTWHPQGGMYKVVEAFEKICYELGVEITYNVNVDQLDVMGRRVSAAHSGHRNFYAEYFVSSADYHFTDQRLLSEKYRNHSHKYWEQKTMSPSVIIYYIGVNKKIPGLLHHNLFFDTDLDVHSCEIYKNPKWPKEPALYVSVTSKTDNSVAPEGYENIVVVMPVAPGLDDHGKIRDYYFDIIIERIEKITKSSFRENIVYHKSYAHSDFNYDYNAFKGNAYGLANTLHQTGSQKPKIKNKYLSNLYYAGQLTIPGPGVPPCIISGKIIADQLFKDSGGLKS